MRRLGVGAACLLLVASIALGACAAPRNTLGTRSSACFRALPTARDAVHNRGRLVGVRRLKRKTVEHAFPKVDLGSARDYCVVGFSGPYKASDVDRSAGTGGGRYAVVITSARGTTVVHTFLVDRIPLRLRR